MTVALDVGSVPVHVPRGIIEVEMKVLTAIFLLALLSGCAAYNYPVQHGGDGVYYASSPPSYTYVDSYGGFSYYSPYFYPYYFSVWYSPWNSPWYGYGGYWPTHYWCPPYRVPRDHYRGGYGDYAGMAPIGSGPGSGVGNPASPVVNPLLLQSTDALSLRRETMQRGQRPGRPAASTGLHSSSPRPLASSRPATSGSNRMPGSSSRPASSTHSTRSSRSPGRSRPSSSSQSSRVSRPNPAIRDQ